MPRITSQVADRQRGARTRGEAPQNTPRGLAAPRRGPLRPRGPDTSRERAVRAEREKLERHTVTEAPTRTETYAPTRMTEAPSYAPTTDTYAPTMAPTATGVPTFTDAPTGAPTNATNAPTPPARRRLEATVPLPVSKSFHRSGGAHTEARRRLQALSS